MTRAVLLYVTLLLIGCRDQGSAATDAAPPAPVVPMGMASAATLVTTTNAVEVLATVHHPRQAVLGNAELVVTATPGEAIDPDSLLDVLSVPLAVGGTPKRLYTAQRGAEGLAFAGGRLVWIVAPSDDKKEHAKILTATAGAPPTTIAKTYDLDETATASDGTDVFTFGDVKDGKADVLRVGGSGKPTRVTTTGARAVRTVLAVNSTQVFWIQDETLVKAPKAGGDATPVVKVPGAKVQQLAADDTAVYWADLGSGDPAWTGRVKKASLADGKVETISDAPSPVSVAIDADSVFWASGGAAGGRILAQKKTGGPTFVLARDLHGPQSLVVDGQHAYWVDTGDGTVCRTEKTPRAGP